MMPMNGQQWSAVMMQMQMQQLQQMQMQRIHQIQFQQQQMPQFMPQFQQKDDEVEEVPEEERTLFCANIDEKKVDDEMLFELFLQAGPIEKISFPKQKSFCFITYVHSCSPVYAMHLFQNVKLFGQHIVIKFKGTTNPPPLTRRLLPPDWGMSDFTMPDIVPNPFRRSLDNSALRNSRLAAFMDDSRERDDNRNHRRDRSPQKHSRDRGGGGGGDRYHERNYNNNSDRNRSNGADRRSRSHHSSGPYDRKRF